MQRKNAKENDKIARPSNLVSGVLNITTAMSIVATFNICVSFTLSSCAFSARPSEAYA